MESKIEGPKTVLVMKLTGRTNYVSERLQFARPPFWLHCWLEHWAKGRQFKEAALALVVVWSADGFAGTGDACAGGPRVVSVRGP